MLFFPSYKFMQEVYDRFNKEDRDVVKQDSNLTEIGREQFLKQFKEDTSIIAFVVLGGVFSEGIDLVGDRLNGAAIVSVGLPGLSVERNLIKDYYDEKENTGFEYAYIYPGMNKVAQAAGRVIRDKDDKGTVLLIDDRFLKNPVFNNEDKNLAYYSGVLDEILVNNDYIYDFISSKQANIDQLYNGIAKLMIVEVSLEREYNDPQLIFESLNSTGAKLTQADLKEEELTIYLS